MAYKDYVYNPPFKEVQWGVTANFGFGIYSMNLPL